MRILFVLALTSLVRHFDGVIAKLASRGHTIRIATPGRETNWPLPPPLASHPRISEIVCPGERADEWAKPARIYRLLVDYQRYLEPPFLDAHKLRARARAELVEALSDGQLRRLVARCPACNTKIVNDALGALLLGSAGDRGAAAAADDRATFKALVRPIERLIPVDPVRVGFLEAERPDVVLVTPLIFLGPDQTDWVKSARSLRIPVGFPVFSWDNLTTKGVIHEQPDRVFVWNDIQKREAIVHHDVPAENVVITGAPRFDAFLSLGPKRDRAAFCEKYGLRADRPIVTYLCSSDFVAEREAAFVAQWIEEIRREPALSDCNIVVRPHPRSEAQWSGADVSAMPHVAITMPKQMNADRLLYDTLYHSAAVVGLNTSAQIEAALLGKPVLTLLVPEFEEGQQGTLHFRYLLREAGGFVTVAHDFAEHRRQLADAVAGRDDAAAIQAFVERFVRPAGLAQPATPLLADAIESLAARPSVGGLRGRLRARVARA
jgi:hypothetical protein